ncbi:hypothetical protein NLX83_16325 [Allokutzneria sp. A3M-2-11 16]|uniref:hypothetical protein n=1 Tax=Allokutzneria sp. A3M-2-11 16 TaxID=2962043 RepID=UPI0020B7B4D6|nr:hypothetical protein [Allokutzneria sp. A3M-2-11 16]MCP3800832.1 hypothetical protein [Allokutzneria sp. A3M-2-11 16]
MQAATYADSDTPLYLGSLGGSDQRFTHVTHLTAVRPELAAEVVAPQRIPLSLSYDEHSPKLVGEHRIDVVDGKQGGDLKGKLVLLTLDPKTDDTVKAVKAAADAGAKAALVVQPARQVFQPLALPTLNAAEHRLTKLIELLKAGPVTVNLVSTKDNPVSYDIALTAQGKMVDGGRHDVRKEQLAHIDSRYRPGGAKSMRPTMAHAPNDSFPLPQPQGMFRLAAPEVAIGKERTEYVSPGWWLRQLGTDNEPLSEAGYSRFDAGRTYRRDWNSAVFAPAFGRTAVHRIDDKITGMLSLAAPRPAAEGARTWNGSAALQGRTTLLLDGKQVFTTEATGFGTVVPPRQGNYELRATGTRDGTLTTSVDAAWTFRSGPTPDQKPVAVPLLTVDPRISLDHANAAPAAAPLPIRVFAARQPQAAGRATVTELRVALSYDEGRTWTDVPVQRSGEVWAGMLPAAGKAGGFGSLRIEAKDSDGNSVRQTVLRTHALS